MAQLNVLLSAFVLVVLISQRVLAETTTDKVHKKACIRETGVNPSLVDKAFDGNYSENRELKCFFRCYYFESGFINDKGEVQTDKIKAKIPAKADMKAAYQAIESCKNMKGDDSCETAYKLQKCLHDNRLDIH